MGVGYRFPFLGGEGALGFSRRTCRARQRLNDAFHRGIVVRSGEEPRLKSTRGKVYASIKHGVEKCRCIWWWQNP